MFLTKNSSFGNAANSKSQTADARGQSGSVLVAVVGVMAAALVISVLIAAVLSSAFTFSSATRAEVQSQAAAEGGVAAALAGLNTQGGCDASAGLYQRTTNPIYRATVWRSTDGQAWTLGCPISSTTKVRIISMGTAQSPGVLAASANNQKYVEAVYSYGSGNSGGNTPGTAMYLYATGQLDTYQLLSPGGQGSDVGVLTGNFDCTGPTVIEGNVKVAAGSANLTNNCSIEYSLSASGAVQMTTNSNVLGDVTSSGGGVTISNSTSWVGGNVYANGAVSTNGSIGGSVEAVGGVTLVNGSNVSGSIRAGSTVTVQAAVGGNVTTTANLSIVSPGKISGNVTIGGNLTYQGLTNAPAAAALKAQNKVLGTILYLQSNLTAPTPKPAPVVTGWVDFKYLYSDWQANGFTTQLTWPSSLGCRLGDSNSTNPSGVLYPFYQQLKSLSQPTVVDTRGCSSVSGDLTLQLHTDVAFIGNDFNFDQLLISSADSAAHKIWFLVPDSQPTVAGPQCPKKGGNFTISTTSSISSPVLAMAYAPCSIAINNGTVWRGQLYSGDMNGGGGLRQLYYVPLGIPGSTIGGGALPPSPGQTGALIWMRNRNDSGQ
jgi:cytoskeletal protein CcmA (bactofilin family)/type II secretory pathway pseudopilin PulG